jgi:hypothetical protein
MAQVPYRERFALLLSSIEGLAVVRLAAAPHKPRRAV